MNSTYELYYHQQEEQHWWFKARREIVFNLIQKMRLPHEAAILDVGCSGGPLMLALRATGYQNLTGIDVSESGIELARQRGLANVSVMDGSNLAFADKSFDLLIASDVLEHIENEEAALREWVRVLRPGGTLLVFVPAHSYLWSQHDEINHHFRRYSAQHLRTVLRTAGLRIERLSYWNNFLYFPTAVFRSVQRQLPTHAEREPVADFHHFPAIFDKAVLQWLRFENKLLQHVDVPFGVSLFSVAHRPS